MAASTDKVTVFLAASMLIRRNSTLSKWRRRESNQKVGGSTFGWVMETAGVEPA
jgi:hypothetical protein